jgi:predicted DNA-binding transcriptional regulator AlpA
MNALLTLKQVADRLGVTIHQARNLAYRRVRASAGFPRARLVCEGMGRSKARWVAGEVDAFRDGGRNAA